MRLELLSGKGLIQDGECTNVGAKSLKRKFRLAINYRLPQFLHNTRLGCGHHNTNQKWAKSYWL
jgi:hypothetical protein